MPNVMSLIVLSMSIGSMSHVDFKKWPCHPVEFKGQESEVVGGGGGWGGGGCSKEVSPAHYGFKNVKGTCYLFPFMLYPAPRNIVLGLLSNIM